MTVNASEADSGSVESKNQGGGAERIQIPRMPLPENNTKIVLITLELHDLRSLTRAI